MQDDTKRGPGGNRENHLEHSDASDTSQELDEVTAVSTTHEWEEFGLSRGTTPMPVAPPSRPPSPPSTLPDDVTVRGKMKTLDDAYEKWRDEDWQEEESGSVDDTDRVRRVESVNIAGRSPQERTRVSTRDAEETDPSSGVVSDWSMESENAPGRTEIHTPARGRGQASPGERGLFERRASPPQGTPLKHISRVPEVLPSITRSTTFRLLLAAILMLVLLTGLLLYLNMERQRLNESARSTETEAVTTEYHSSGGARH